MSTSFVRISECRGSSFHHDPGVLQLRSGQTQRQRIGVDVLAEDRMFNLRDKLRTGRLEDLLNTDNGILMGFGIARKLSVQADDQVAITTPQGHTMKLSVVGIRAIDDIRSYPSLKTVQKMMQQDNRYVTDIKVKLYDQYDAAALAQTYKRLFGYRAMDREEANATTLIGTTFRNILAYAVSITLLIVAGFGIYNILNMTIYNKMKDITILKARVAPRWAFHLGT